MRVAITAHVTAINNMHGTETITSTRPSLLFLHGAGLNGAMWKPQLDALANDYDVHAIDLPGHGERKDNPFRLNSAVDTVAQTISKMGDKRVITVGLSLGGYVAIAHAAKYPDQTAGLVVSGCCVQYFGVIGILARLQTFLLNFVSERRFSSMQQNMLNNVAPADLTQEIVNRGLSKAGGRDGMREMIGQDFVTMLRKVHVPVLIANGERDTLNRKYAQTMADAAYSPSQAIIANGGHLCSLEQPHQFTNLVRDFTDRRPRN